MAKKKKVAKKKPYITNDPQDPRIQAYQDSLDLYNNAQHLYNKYKDRFKLDQQDEYTTSNTTFSHERL
jgi:hypothetical protein